MSTTYKAVTMDGQEHAGLDLWTIKQWYFARRLRGDSFILSPELGEWKLLKNLFDPAQWEAEERAVRGLGPGESINKPATLPNQLARTPDVRDEVPYKYDRVNERGLRVAGTLLCINAAITLISLIFMAVRHPGSPEVSSSWGFSILIDVIVGAKLLHTDNATRWKVIALIRVGLGALIALALMLAGPTLSIKLLGLLELAFESTFFLLLIGDASRERVTAGVMAFVISVMGLVAFIAKSELTGNSVMRHEMIKYIVPGHSFGDSTSGARLELPDGWIMITNNNPVAPMPKANLLAFHPDSGGFAALIGIGNSWGPDLDAGLSALVAERQKEEPTVVEVERVNSSYGRLAGRKAILTWQSKGKQIKGEVSLARNGDYNIILIEWCPAENYAEAHQQFAALEERASAGPPQIDPSSSWRGKN